VSAIGNCRSVRAASIAVNTLPAVIAGALDAIADQRGDPGTVFLQSGGRGDQLLGAGEGVHGLRVDQDDRLGHETRVPQ
jgi:hypothetical protein